MGGSLVAPVEDSTKWHTGMGIVDNGVSAAAAIENGDWAEGIANGAATGLAVLGAIADPLAAAISAGVGWVLEHCGPFREALDKLAGNPDVISSFAATWTNVSKALQEAGTEFQAAIARDTAQWRSQAVDAYRGTANMQAEFIKAAGVAAAGVSGAVSMGGMVVATVRSTVRDLISEAIGNIISKALQALFIVTIPKVAAEIIALVAKWSLRIADWLRKLVRIMSRLAELCKKLRPVFEQADRLNKLQNEGIDNLVSRVPGLKSPMLDRFDNGSARPFVVRNADGQPAVDPNFEQYPRVPLFNNTLTEGAKPIQDENEKAEEQR